jgi:hypothetical protein
MDPKAVPAISQDVPTSGLSSELASTDDSHVASQANEQAGKPEARGKKGSWLSSKAQKLADWLATSEPSAQAFSQHRKETFKKAGISHKDPEPPHAKLHAPIGEIPSEAIRHGSGPSPEELALKKAAERRRRRRERADGAPGGAASSTESWSVYSGQGSVSDSLGTFPYTGSST